MRLKQNSRLYFILKRTLDILLSLLYLILFSPFYLILLIINVFATKGAPLYFEERFGKDGKIFKMPKFRSMYKDANIHPEKYLNEEQLRQWREERKVDNDGRITPFGRFLRKSSLDETVQVFSIFIGKMAIVGPRPVTKREILENYSEEEQKIILSTRPGLISNWGVNGRNLKSYNSGERQALELSYFENRSLWYDFVLILKSIKVVLTGKGAR